MERVTQVRRYARALFELCHTEAEMDAVARELEELAQAFRVTDHAYEFLNHPGIPFDRKRAVLNAAMKPDMPKPSAGLIKLLVKHRRMHLLTEVLAEFQRLQKRRYGIVEVEIETALPLSPAAKSELSHALSRLIRREVRLAEELNPNLIGGVRLRLEDRVIDASIAGRLDRLRAQIARGKLSVKDQR